MGRLQPWGLSGRLTRRTSNRRFIPAVDGLRFVAIALVVVYHLDIYVRDRQPGLHGASWVHDVVARGDTGVLLFFGISGFILGLPFARAAAGEGPPVSTRRYFVRRLTRLEPPYIIAMTVLLAAFVVIRHQSLSELLPHHLVSLGYLHNLVYREWNPVNGVVWSLEVEVQFYVLAPLLALAYRLRTALLRAGTFVVLGAAAAAAQLGPLRSAGWRVDLSLAGHLQHFLAGMLLADLVARRAQWSPTTEAVAEDERRSAWSARWADLAGVAGLTLVLLSAGSPRARAILIPIGVAGCLVAALRGPVVARVLSRPTIYVIGGMCYTIYLFHYATISLVGPQTGHVRLGHSYPVNLLVQGVLIGVVLAVVSLAFFVLVERPCMDPAWPAKAVATLRRVTGRAVPVAAGNAERLPTIDVSPSDDGAAKP